MEKIRVDFNKTHYNESLLMLSAHLFKHGKKDLVSLSNLEGNIISNIKYQELSDEDYTRYSNFLVNYDKKICHRELDMTILFNRDIVELIEDLMISAKMLEDYFDLFRKRDASTYVAGEDLVYDKLMALTNNNLHYTTTDVIVSELIRRHNDDK